MICICRPFYPHLETLLDESTLVGRSRSNQEALRTLAYSALAELVHNLRQQLTELQLGRIVNMFARWATFITGVPVGIELQDRSQSTAGCLDILRS